VPVPVAGFQIPIAGKIPPSPVGGPLCSVSEPDYIDSDNKAQKSESDPAVKASNLRFSGGLTEEKAKQLRKMTVGTESFHDTMYHSAIASRLASDFKACSDL
jgi:hypothetical protein